MVKKPNRNGERKEFENDVDALFRLPSAEFTGARNALAARLKKAGNGDDAREVKALGKPSISAWVVNQLYWLHRDDFDQLIATGQRFRKAQKAGKVADINETLEVRRDALSHLSDLAVGLLQDAGHNPTLDTVRRITATLEALSVYASLPDGPRAGRLTHDVDPPGFDSLASLMSGSGMPKLTLVPPRIPQTQKSRSVDASAGRKSKPGDKARRLEETRKRIAAAKVSLQNAKRALSEARAREQRTQSVQKKADAQAKETEKQRREAEQRYEKARAASEFASRRAAHAADEVEGAANAVTEAMDAVERASEELEVLSRESARG